MRRTWIMLLVVVVVMVLAVPAGAGPGKPDCAADPTHPSCKTDTEEPSLAGDTCYAFGEWGAEPVRENFKVTLTDAKDAYCIDVIAGAGDWKVTIETEGMVRELRLFLRDAVAPGDGCFQDGSCGYRLRKDIPNEWVLPTVPGAYVNACGTGFGEYVGTYWDGAGELVLGTYHNTVNEGIESPLAFMPSITGKNAEVTLTVYLPDLYNEPIPLP